MKAKAEDMDSLRIEISELRIENSIHRSIAVRGRRRINLLESLLKEIPKSGLVTEAWIKRKDEALAAK